MTHYYYNPGAYMQNGMQPANHANGMTQQQYEMNVLLEAAKTGAIIGGTGAAAMQLHKYQQGGMTWQEAATGTVKGAFQVGVAATAATAVGRMFGQNNALSLAATLATGTAVMYVLNRPKPEEQTDE